MGKISEKSPLFRTKQVMLEDLAFVLSQGNLRHGTKFAVLDQIIWVWSEFDGKHDGCRFWSNEALQSGSKRAGLIHEHLVPRNIIRSKIFALEMPDMHSIKCILEGTCIGVVVTKTEDDRLREFKLNKAMPDGWDGKDVWARYRKANIPVMDMRNKKGAY